MQNEVLSNIEKMNQTGLDSVKRLGEINARVLGRVAEYQLAVASDYIDGGVKQLQLLGEVKDPKDALSAQSKLVAELNEKLVSRAKEAVQVMMETRDELIGWVEDGIKSMSPVPAPKATTKKAA